MNNLFDLTGKVALVTGGEEGLGADAVVAYAEAGADIAIIGLEIEDLNNMKNKIESLGKKCIVLECNVSHEKEVKNAIQTIYDYFGHIDILLNNAGISMFGGVEDLTEEEWDREFDVNVKGIFLVSKYVVPIMKKQNYGKIINVSSINAKIADKNDAFIRHAYNASKSAVLGLTKGMACSYARYGINVNAVGPGLFESAMTKDTLMKSDRFLHIYTEMCPSARVAKKGELNGTILYFSSSACDYVQGQFIIVDGGTSIV